mgnify:CR=1 FL=1
MFWLQMALLAPLQQHLSITSRTIRWIGTYLLPSVSSPSRLNRTPSLPHAATAAHQCQLRPERIAVGVAIRPPFASSVLTSCIKYRSRAHSIPDDDYKPTPNRSGFTNSWRLGSTSRSPSLHAISQTTTTHTRHHQLKTPRLGDDRLAYLGSPGTKHLGLYQPQVGGDCRTRTKMSFEPSSVRHFRTISDDPARLVRCEDAADRPPGRETSILRPSTARA